MGKWLTKKIKDLCQIGRGRVISQEEIQNNPGVYPVYSSQSMNKGEMGRIDSYDFEGEYVTWTTDGAYAGTVFHRDGKFNCTNVCGTLKAKEEEKLDLLFLSYLLSTQAKKYVSYVGNPKLMNGVMADIELLLPENKPEQTRIAQILSTADAAIAQTEDLITKYQRIKTGLMQDLLTKGIDEHGNIRSELTHRFKTENGLRVPEEWEVTIIGTCLEGIEQGWSPDCEGEPAPTGEWGVLKTTSVTWEGFNEDENKKLPENLFPKKQYEIKNGDVLMTRGGPNSRVGVVAFVKETRSNLILCDKIYRLIPKVKLLPEYLAIALSSSTTQRHLSNLKTGMAESQTNISQKIVESLSILVPSPIEQQRIIDKLNGIDKMLKQNQRSLNKFQSLKTGLMQDLLSGKVRITVKEKTLVNP